MDLARMIAELRSESAAIEEAMVALERLSQTHRKRRGRPPAWIAVARSAGLPPAERKRRAVSPEVRKRMAEAQKKRWAAARKAGASSAQ
jgi:soluble lytic murein transglycosylase-like protein